MTCSSTSEILVRAGSRNFEHIGLSVKMVLLTTRLTIFEAITASRVRGYSIIIRTYVHVSTAFTAQAVISNLPR